MKDMLKVLAKEEKIRTNKASLKVFNELAEEEEEKEEEDTQAKALRELSKEMASEVDVTKVLAFRMLGKDLIEKGEQLARLYSDGASDFMSLSNEEDDKEDKTFAEITALSIIEADKKDRRKVIKQLKELGF